MEMEKFGHSCVQLRTPQAVLTFDPGVFSKVSEALTRSQDLPHSVFVTHEHPDHVDPQALVRVLERDRTLEVFAPASVTEMLATAGGQRQRLHTLVPGKHVTWENFSVQVFGGQHSLIHPRVPVVSNLGYLVNDTLFHPGDSLELPAISSLDVLLLPVQAPWATVGQVTDFLCGVKPVRTFPIHDGLLNSRGVAVIEDTVHGIAKLFDIRYEQWPTSSVLRLDDPKAGGVKNLS